MAQQCLGRIMRDQEANRGRFLSARKRFYFEYRCSNQADGQLCKRCLEWKLRGEKKRDPCRNHYGLVSEPIPDECHIYGSAWYESKVKEYGQPSETDMARAKQAQEIARKGLEQKATPAPAQTVVEEPKKRGRKKKVVADQPQPAPAPAPAPGAKATKRRPKEAELPKAQKLSVQAVEEIPRLKDIEIVKIVVKPFTHNDTSYFRDVKKNKLYAVGQDKRPSRYVGRWDPESETLDTEFPDSDVE